ncbi:MAG: helix-turn-helix transcriptional regulator [Clostridia bacterium]|nr:helix-turn-helix transcriptional regulator [Clostridia bacterium]
MIIADKIIRLRKKKGWSQEDLAEKMDVSRQAVSKWESAQTIPDLGNILVLSNLFGVTTDYLLKDEIEDEEFTDNIFDNARVKKVAIEEADTYLKLRKQASWLIAIATFLCILSPITLIVLGAASEFSVFGLTETVAAVIGLVVLFALILCAVPIYLLCGFKNEPYAFLDKKIAFELEYGVRIMVAERHRKFRSTYIRWNIVAACICIFSPVPLIVSAFTENEMVCVLMLAVTMVLAGCGASIFIVVGIQNASFQKLLMEGEYTEQEKSKSSLREVIGFAYWGILIAVYLAWSFLANQWHISWLVFAVGGVLFSVIMNICDYIADKYKKN